MVRLNEKSIVDCTTFMGKQTLNCLIVTKFNLMPNLDVPRCIIKKYATSVRPFKLYKRPGRAD